MTKIKRNGTWETVTDAKTGLVYYRSTPQRLGPLWINGKPIYRIAVYVDNVGPTSVSVFDTGLGTTVEDVIRIETNLQRVDTYEKTHIGSIGTPLGGDSRHSCFWYNRPSGCIRANATEGYAAPYGKVSITMDFTLQADIPETVENNNKQIVNSDEWKGVTKTFIKKLGEWKQSYQQHNVCTFRYKLNESVDTGWRWVDGKPIYARVIKTTSKSFPEDYSTPVGIGIDTIDTLIDLRSCGQHCDNGANVLEACGELIKSDTQIKGALTWYQSQLDKLYTRAELACITDTITIMYFTLKADAAKPGSSDPYATFSTEETFTGKYWLDGKKIYRKCYTTLRSGGTYGGTAMGTRNIPTGLPINTIDNIVDFRAVLNTADGQPGKVYIRAVGGLDWDQPGINPVNVKFASCFYNETENGLYSIGKLSYANIPLAVTIEYTKK